MKRWGLLAGGLFLLACVVAPPWWAEEAAAQGRPALPAFAGAKEGAVCIGCHSRMNNALVYEWRASRMGQKGVNCFDCHRAEKGDPDAFEHNGFLISVIVSPKDCGRCHQKQVDEQKGSHHAKGGQILASLDNFLGASRRGPTGSCGRLHAVSRVADQSVAGREIRSSDVAQQRDRPDQSRRKLGELHRLPYASPILRGAGPPPRRVREVPSWAGSPTDGSVQGVKARNPLRGVPGQAEYRSAELGRGKGLHDRAHVFHLPHGRYAEPGRDP